MSKEMQTSIPGVEKNTTLQQLAEALEKAANLYSTPKNYAKAAIENPEATARVVAAAKKLTPHLREIKTFG